MDRREARLRALLKLEWSGTLPQPGADPSDPANGCCPQCCGHLDTEKMMQPAHETGCAIDAELTAAGLPDQPARDSARSTLFGTA